MNTDYKFYLTCELPNGDRKCSAFNVSREVARDAKWEPPYDLCSDAMTAAMADGVTLYESVKIDGEREKLAAEVARLVTARMMDAIKGRDLRNGYKQNDCGEPRPGGSA